MKDSSVTYRISPALFAEYCYFTPIRVRNYRLARTLCIVALCIAGIITAIWGFAYGKSEITIIGAIIVLCSVMISFVQKKYIKSRYNMVYGRNMITYTASFTKNGTFTISAGDITEKYGRQDIKNVYYIRGGFAIRTENKATFLVPAVNTLPDFDWFKQTYGSKFKKCA